MIYIKYSLLYKYYINNLNSMVINLSNLFNIKNKNSKISDFQDLEHLDGLAISVVNAKLYNPPRDDVVLFYFR